MKKHRDADALAARIAEAANQPAAVVANRPRVSPSPETPTETEQATSSKPTRKRYKGEIGGRRYGRESVYGPIAHC